MRRFVVALSPLTASFALVLPISTAASLTFLVILSFFFLSRSRRASVLSLTLV